MKILSVRKGFTADHSSTSYEFLAVDKPLKRDAQAHVSSLSRRASPTRRRVSFIYNAEGYDIPGGWEPLMRDYYDVMYRESYYWWSLAMAFDASEEQRRAIEEYAFEGGDGLGVQVTTHEDRIVVTVDCRLDPGILAGSREYFDNTEDEEGEEDEPAFETDDALLDLLTRVRAQLVAGDYRALYAVWEQYGREPEDDEDVDLEESGVPPVPPDREEGRALVERFAGILAPE